MSKQTEEWRGLCAVLHDFAKKFRESNAEAAAALDCASEEVFKICRCLDKSEAKVADLEAVQQVLGPHDDRTGDKYGPCATCGISPEIVAERVLSARERGDMALNHVAELEIKLDSLRYDEKRHVKEMQEIVAVLAGRRVVSLSIVAGGVSRLFEQGKTLQTRLDELEVENSALKTELKKCVSLKFSGEINPVVDPDLDPDAW